MTKDKKEEKFPSGLPLDQFGEAVNRAIKKAVYEALLMHKKLGNPVAIWRDGKVVILQPDEIILEEPEL